MAEDYIAVANPDMAALHAAMLDARGMVSRLQERIREAAATVNRRVRARSRRRRRRTRHR